MGKALDAWARRKSYYMLHMKKRCLILRTVILISCCINCLARDYYVSPHGDDSSPGTKGKPWRTIGHLNSAKFQPGDRILLEGGQSFAGTLQLASNDSGTPGNRLTVASYGTGRAVINGGVGRAISIDGCNHVVIRDLLLVGSGRKSANTESGLVLQSVDDVEVDQVEVTGFRQNGVEMRTVQNVRLTRVHAHQNGKDGIISSAPRGASPTTSRNRNIYVGHCLAENNSGDPTLVRQLSGSGIVIGQTDGALVEYSEAAFNGWDMGYTRGNGPVGIWTYSSDKVIIQYCISHHNRTTTGDGGGFDIDGGVTNSIMQYNYSHDNFGPGYEFCLVGQGKFTNNMMRYNISQDDGLKRHVASIHLWIQNEADSTLIYNNTVFNSQGPAVVFSVPEDNKLTKLPSFLFYNNILMSEGPQVEYYLYNSKSESIKAPQKYEDMGRFLGNLYWGSGGRGFRSGDYTNFESWVAASGQEKMGDRVVGRFADPLLLENGIGQLMDATKLATLVEFQLTTGSPAIDNGLNLRELFGIDPGPRDFYGTALPMNGRFDIGAHELVIK